MLINSAGLSPSQAPIEAILKVDLYGTSILLEEVGKVIKQGGSGVTISSQSGHRMPALGAGIDEQLATTQACDGRGRQMGRKRRTHQRHLPGHRSHPAGHR